MILQAKSERSFYHMNGEVAPSQVCQGMACFVARRSDPDRWRRASMQQQTIYCLGKCYEAPASNEEDSLPVVSVSAPEAVVLGNLEPYCALHLARNRTPEELIGEIEISGLRGRGGAGFPAGKKWRAVALQNSIEKFVVANADEGDPGAYVDRYILEANPHRLLEGMIIAARAVGATRGYIYLRKEYPRAHSALLNALEHIQRDPQLRFPIDIVMGQGSYVCGEETAMLNSMEGRRPEPRLRPPYPTEHGLYGRPTLVNNVETLASIPWIVLHGGNAYSRLGFSSSRGTKVVSLNSLFERPGLYEVEFGIPVRHIVEDLGGGLKTGRMKGVVIGGPLAGIIPPHLLDTPFGFDELRAIGASVGHGGVIAFDEHTSIAQLVHHVFAFGAFESCGKCTPCRNGSSKIHRLFDQILEEGLVPSHMRAECLEILNAMEKTSFCGHGVGLAEFAGSAWKYYHEELDRCFA